MNDMSAVIVPKSDQINADDLIGGPMTIRVTGVKVSPGTEQPVSIQFEGTDKVFRPCKSMSRVLVAIWGADSSQYAGKSMTLYRDPKVKWGGMEIGGIRISHMTDLDAPRVMALTESKANRKPFTVKPLVVEDAADASLSLATVRGWLDECATLDDLKTTWSMKSVAPFREALQSHLNDRKAALSSADIPAPDHVGSEFGLDPIKPTLVPDFTDRLAKCELRADFDKLDAEFMAVADNLADAEYDAIKPMIDEGRAKFLGPGAA